MQQEITDDDLRGRLAANVRRLIAERGSSQAELADASGQTRIQISRVCRGEYLPGSGSVLRIASALGVSVEDLFAEVA